MTSKSKRGGTVRRTPPTRAKSPSSPTPAFEKAVRRDRQLRRMCEGEDRGQSWPHQLCTPKRPCRSAACLPCRQRTHENFIQNYLPVAESIWARASHDHGGGKMEAITIVPSFGRISRGHLQDADLVRIRKKMLQLVRHHAPRAKLYLFIDISLNKAAGPSLEDHWQIHAHGLVLNLSLKAKKKLARALGKQERTHCCPLVVKPMWQLSGWLEYMSKPRFKKRMPNPDSMPSATPQRKLTLKEDYELNRWLRQYRVDQLQGTASISYRA